VAVKKAKATNARKSNETVGARNELKRIQRGFSIQSQTTALIGPQKSFAVYFSGRSLHSSMTPALASAMIILRNLADKYNTR
jgi:hypothetical protein